MPTFLCHVTLTQRRWSFISTNNNETHILFSYTPKRRSSLLLWTVFKMRKLLSLHLFFMKPMKATLNAIWVLASHSEGRQDCCHLTKPNKFKHESGVIEGDSCIRKPFPSEQAPTSILLKSVESSSHPRLIHFLSCCCHRKIAVEKRQFNSIIGG